MTCPPRILKLKDSRHCLAAVVISLAALPGPCANAQPPPFAWAKRVASTVNPDSELHIGLAIDRAANLYLTGWFDGTNDFGHGVVLTNRPGGGQDVFVAKFNAVGQALWARSGGGATPEWDAGRGIGVDEEGNVYVTGQFFGDADFDGHPLSGSNQARFFLAKYDAQGTLQWVRQSTGDDRDNYGSGLAVDSTGNCYALGYMDDYMTVKFEERFSLTDTNSGYQTFLVKYDPKGTVLWAELLESSRACYCTTAALDGDGNVYVGGNFRTSLRIQTTHLITAGEKDGVVAKFNGAGVLQWAKQIAGASDASTLGVSANEQGSVYAAGGFGSSLGDTACFGTSVCLTNMGGGLPGSGIGDAFLAKYDAVTGATLWAVRAGGTKLDGLTGVSVHPDGSLYVGGGFDGIGLPAGFQAVVAAYDTNGIERWTRSSSGTDGAVIFSGPVVDAAGNCYVAGWFQRNAVFGAHTLAGQGYWDLFLTKVGTAPLPLALGIQWNDAGPRLSVVGELGNEFVLEQTPALPAVVWQPLLTNTLASVPFIWREESAAAASTRFYRARLP